MKRVARILSVVLALALVMSFAACQTAAPSSAPVATTATPVQTSAAAATATEPPAKVPVTMKYVIPGSLNADEEKVMALINQKLSEDGVGIQFVREAIAWDVWADKLNLKFTSGEEFDMFHIMQDWIPYTSYYSRGELVDLMDLVDQYGPVVKAKIPQEMWEGSKIGGRNYIIPTYWIDFSVDSQIFYRADVMEKFNLKIPTTPEEILDCFRTVRAGWTGKNKPILNLTIPSYDPAVSQLSPKIHRYYDDWPFIVRDAFFQVFQDGTVKSWFESEDFKKDCAFMNQAYKDGIIQPDVLSVNSDWASNYVSNGDWFMWFFTDYQTSLKNNPDLKIEDMKSFMLAPDKDVIRNWGIKNCNGISITSKHPESAVLFINWLWDKQENYDLYMYGIQGTHWNTDPNNPRGLVKVNDPNTNTNTYQTGDDWKIGQIQMVRYDTTGFMAYNDLAYTENKTAHNSIAGSFFFDATAVATELSNVQAEAATVMTPIVMGVQDYDTYYTAAVQRLKAAGLDKLVAEYQKQLSAFIGKQ